MPKSKKSGSKRKAPDAFKAGPKNLSKLPKGLRDYWKNKRSSSK